MVRGLQPNEDYVFAVAGYTSGGKLVGKAIGQTSRPYRTTFSLPLLTAWAYCCQVREGGREGGEGRGGEGRGGEGRGGEVRWEHEGSLTSKPSANSNLC